MFAEQLDTLCTRPERRVTNVMLWRALTDRGCDVSKPYLSQLRNGVRADPAVEIVEALADFFGVPVDYFFAPPQPPDPIVCMQADIETLRDVDNAVLARLLMSVQDISLVSFSLLINFADRLRVAEGLPQFSADFHIYRRPAPRHEGSSSEADPSATC